MSRSAVIDPRDYTCGKDLQGCSSIIEAIVVAFHRW